MNKCYLLIYLFIWHFSISIMGQSLNDLHYDDKTISIIRENASIFVRHGLYANAISLEKELSTYFLDNGEMGDYAISLSITAAYYSDSGEYEQALYLSRKALDCISDTTLIDKEGRFEIVLHHAMFCENIGNHEDALYYGKLSVELAKSLVGSNSYPKSLTFLAFVYSELGDFHRAISLSSEAKDLYEKSNIERTDEAYLTTINDLGAYYCGIGDIKAAITIANQYIDELVKRGKTNQQRYIVALNNLARYLAINKKNQDAIKLSLNALQIINTSFSDNAFLKGRTLEHLSTFCANTGDFIKANNYLEAAISSFSKVWREDRPAMVNEHRKHLRLLYLCDSLSCREREIVDVEHHITNIVTTAFSYLPNSGRNQFWDIYYRSWFLEELPFYVYSLRTDKLIEEEYNSILFSKGILLNTEIGVKQLIETANDSTILNKFCKLQQRKISTLLKDEVKYKDSVFWNAEDEEAKLMSLCKTYGDYTNRLRVNWKDVQRGLGDNEIAIEFLDFPIYNSDSIMYVALTLKKEYDRPHMVTLFEEKQLKAISEDVYYTKNDIANLVWKPLEEELIGVKNIYFAPSGELHRIGIENLPISSTEIISDAYTLHRLSSTRQLAVIQDETEGNNNILYGGLDYDEKSDAISTDSTSTKEPVLRFAFSRANVDSLSLRSSFEYLEGTKKEADMIAADMKLHHIPFIYYNGIDGTEETFKQLDGTKPKLLHIATHGFFLTEEESEKSRFARPEIELMNEWGQMAGRSVEDKPMTRSGLLFSGCNHAIHHEQIPDGEEDGILTAQEISMLDLRGLDLVVLSACQTGLGDIISGEGVFGLQRGFKKAGAKTILMSLDKVDDEATRILMVEFYRNLINGKTKRQSLQDAQHYLRKVDNGKFDDPKYWASFIMLDGLN